MNIDRRHFLSLTAGTAAIAATDCLGLAAGGNVVDAGPVANFTAEGVFGDFRTSGFFVIRKGGKLGALSSVCTHRKVQVTAEHDCSFFCKRHGSTFDPAGHVTKGPAQRDLPTLATNVSGGHLLVTVPAA